ncbi:MAG: hypothetical protein QFX40_07640 [Archaeoglobales archaeon]|nr:hypothetical protein [Archaeoglobales archaeon]
MTAKMLLLPLIIVALSVSYSVFTDSVKVSGQVTTSNLEWRYVDGSFEYGDYKLENGEFNPQSPNIVGENLGTVNCDAEDIQNGATTFSCTISNAYPGYGFYVDFKIKNTGEIPSKLKQILVDCSGANCEQNGVAQSMRIAYRLSYNTTGGLQNENPDGGYIAGLTISQFADNVTQKLSGKIFNKNGWIKFGGDEGNTIYFYFPYSSNPPQGETLRFNITFVFTQFNS